MPETRYTNRLIDETSPYLLQHAHNPVDWYPWGDEAFAKARAEDKPILLSCGYSACHWCHVMERESFEDPEIAALMNKYFVNIKVDREERPDLDQLYQEAVQAIAGQGGWPLTAFLDHQRRPFFGGTYYPPTPRYGRMSLPQLLEAVQQRWSDQRDRITEAGKDLANYLKSVSDLEPDPEGLPESDFPKRVITQLLRHFDSKHGGFGGAPKFPNPGLLRLLFSAGTRHQYPIAIEQALFTLKQMARGGIYDQLGGGFHRYATDERWLVPHFEKMLYDNAQLLRLYGIGYQITADPELQEVARGTSTYLRRELMAPEGGFYATQDADSEGEEGKYFVWEQAELNRILNEDESRLIRDYYGVTDTGNFEGKNILNRLEGSAMDNLSQDTLTVAKARLLAEREQRVKPFRDEKIIASWNGLVIGALAYAYQVFQDESDYKAAKGGAEFSLNSLRLADGSLARVYKDGQAKGAALLDDYAFLAQGLLDLYEADFKTEWLKQSLNLTKIASEKFGSADGIYYLTAAGEGDLMVRPRSGNDQAIPSGVAVQVENLLRLAAFTGELELRQAAELALKAYSKALRVDNWGYASLIYALDMYNQGLKEFTFLTAESEVPEILVKLRQSYVPYRVLVWSNKLEENFSNHPAQKLLENRSIVQGKPTCYACFDYHCLPPVTEWQELEEIINGRQ